MAGWEAPDGAHRGWLAPAQLVAIKARGHCGDATAALPGYFTRSVIRMPGAWIVQRIL
jgi:hypothetical protein